MTAKHVCLIALVHVVGCVGAVDQEGGYGPADERSRRDADAAQQRQSRIDLKIALKRTAGHKPLRANVGFAITGKQVAFSPDSKHLIVDGKVYRTSDCGKTAVLKAATKHRILLAPDGKSLYLLGYSLLEGVAVAQWPSGEILRRFEGHAEPISSGTLSADGKTLMTTSHYEDVVRVWDTAAGKVVKSYRLNEYCSAAALSPDGKVLALETSRGVLTVRTIAGGKARTLDIDNDAFDEALFTTDGKYLLVLSHDYAPNESQLSVHAVGSKYARVSKLTIENVSSRCVAMTVSPDGHYLAFGSLDGRVWTVDLHTLKTVTPLIADKASSRIAPGRIAFSPDGKLLAVGSAYDRIRLFNVGGTFEPVATGSDHRGEVENAYFSADGKVIRTIGEFGVVCLWDAATLKLLKRFDLPRHTTPFSIRPSDGKYALCSSTAGADVSAMTGGRTPPPATMVDMDNGKVVSTIDLPLFWGVIGSRLYWCGRNQAAVWVADRLQRIDCVTGNVLHGRGVLDAGAASMLWHGRGEVTEDHKRIFMWDRTHGKYSTRRIMVWSVDIETGKVLGRCDTVQYIGGGGVGGLVPGGKHFFIAGEGMYILSRETGKTVRQRQVGHEDIRNVAFSPDGARYAVVTYGGVFSGDSLEQLDPETTSVVRIHETLTGKTLMAFPSPMERVRALRFSPDGKGLLLAGKSIVELWPTTLPRNADPE